MSVQLAFMLMSALFLDSAKIFYVMPVIPLKIVAGFGGRIKPTSFISQEGMINSSGANITQTGTFADVGGLGNTTQPASWRTWSIHRAGFSEDDFEGNPIKLY